MSTPTRTVYPIPKLALESMNGQHRIDLDDDSGWTRMPGSTGLKMPPMETIATRVPGVQGAVLQEVRALPRPVFIPIYCHGNSDHLTFLQMEDKMRQIVDPFGARRFRIIGTTARGSRELIVTYDSGLEGADGADVEGHSWCKIGLNATAFDPFARDMADRELEFRVTTAAVPFLGVVGGSDAPFPPMLTSGAVIGSDMPIQVYSKVPVYPRLDLVGPMDSFVGDLVPTVVDLDGNVIAVEDEAWHVDIPAGVPAGSTLTLVTDPRARSIRLDGDLAAGRVALGSALRPFYPGLNTLNVAAPGGSEDTRILLSWRESHWSLW